MFRSIPIVTARHRPDATRVPLAGYRRETITLGWEDRLRIRARRTSDQGFEFGTALERGTVLAGGDLFVFDAQQVVVEVREKLEPVFVIRPAAPEAWGRFAYHIGNSHQPLMVGTGALICADLPGMEQVLRYHSIPFTREMMAFTPVGQIPDHQHAIRA